MGQHFGDPVKLNAYLNGKKSTGKPYLLTKNVSASIKAKDELRNGLNTLFVAGSGVNPDKALVLPNLLQANMSYIVTDPGLDLYSKTKNKLIDEGYDIQTISLDGSGDSVINMFDYFKTDDDIYRIIGLLISAVNATKIQDPFWNCACVDIVSAIVKYMKDNLSEEEQNCSTLWKLIQGMKPDMTGSTDQLFSSIPQGLARKYSGYFNVSTSPQTRASTLLIINACLKGLTGWSSVMDSKKNKKTVSLQQIFKKKTCIFVDPGTSLSAVWYDALILLLSQGSFERADDLNWESVYKLQVYVTADFMISFNLFDSYLSKARCRNISYTVIGKDSQTFAKMCSEYKCALFDFILLEGPISENTAIFIRDLIFKKGLDISFEKDLKYDDYADPKRKIDPVLLQKMKSGDAFLLAEGFKPVFDKKLTLKEKKS